MGEAGLSRPARPGADTDEEGMCDHAGAHPGGEGQAAGKDRLLEQRGDQPCVEGAPAPVASDASTRGAAISYTPSAVHGDAALRAELDPRPDARIRDDGLGRGARIGQAGQCDRLKSALGRNTPTAGSSASISARVSTGHPCGSHLVSSKRGRTTLLCVAGRILAVGSPPSRGARKYPPTNTRVAPDRRLGLAPSNSGRLPRPVTNDWSRSGASNAIDTPDPVPSMTFTSATPRPGPISSSTRKGRIDRLPRSSHDPRRRAEACERQDSRSRPRRRHDLDRLRHVLRSRRRERRDRADDKIDIDVADQRDGGHVITTMSPRGALAPRRAPRARGAWRGTAPRARRPRRAVRGPRGASSSGPGSGDHQRRARAGAAQRRERRLQA